MAGKKPGEPSPEIDGFRRMFDGASVILSQTQQMVKKGLLARDVIAGPDGKPMVVLFRVRSNTPRCDRCHEPTAARRVRGGFRISLKAAGEDEHLEYSHLCGFCRLQFVELAKLTRAHVRATLETFHR